MHEGSSVKSGLAPGTLRPEVEFLPLGHRGLNQFIRMILLNRRLATMYDLTFNTPMHEGSSVKLGLARGTLWPKSEFLPLGHRGLNQFNQMILLNRSV
ncbi:hypothetical protein AVEN_120464-1 [Araneus ventricosus]|uniref:Uncharacterized protein n=1 Tax=Araneus ventricosus TaxID=182803 RepID=A0A4Y2P1Q3_ARAVE|nr:hypothetical protein AVEN_120464-1 [Araneus ventricosus]